MLFSNPRMSNKPISKSLKTVLSWNANDEIGYKTDAEGTTVISILCKICVKYKDRLVCTNKGLARQASDAFINGTNVVTKTQVRYY